MGTKSKAPGQLREFQAQQAFERNVGRLRLELSMGAPRRHLDVLVELLDWLLPVTGKSMLTDHYREELAELRQMVATRGNLRLVKGFK